VLALADKGPLAAMREDRHLRAGLNVHRGEITHPAVAKALGAQCRDALAAIGS
jgi:alanine dehydrogenase